MNSLTSKINPFRCRELLLPFVMWFCLFAIGTISFAFFVFAGPGNLMNLLQVEPFFGFVAILALSLGLWAGIRGAIPSIAYYCELRDFSRRLRNTTAKEIEITYSFNVYCSWHTDNLKHVRILLTNITSVNFIVPEYHFYSLWEDSGLPYGDYTKTVSATLFEDTVGPLLVTFNGSRVWFANLYRHSRI